MNQKTLPTSRRKVRSISTTSSGPGIVRRASALGMDETLPHFALGKSANLMAVAASLWEAQSCRRSGSRLSGCRAKSHLVSNPVDIPQATALHLR